MDKQKEIPFIFLLIEILAITFSIHIKGFEGIFTIRNIAIALLIIAFVVYHKKLPLTFGQDLNDRWFALIWLILVIYSLFLVLLNGSKIFDSHSAFRSSFNFLIMVIITPFFLISIEQSFERYARAVMIATTIQSLIVISCFLFQPVKSFIFQLQSFDENFLYYRTVGLGIAGAGGTVYLFCGFMIMCYYIAFFKPGIVLYIMQFITLFAIILVGRTGFYMSIVTILLTAFIAISNKNKKLLKSLIVFVIAAVISIIIVVSVSSHLEINSSLLQSSFRRLPELWTSNATLKAIKDMERPQITLLSLFFGVGVEKGYGFDGIRIWNDSGYIQRIFSLGVIPGVFSYIVLFLYCNNLIKRISEKKKRLFWFIMLLLMFIIDYKEAFIYYLALPFTIIVSLKLEAQERFGYGISIRE